VDWGGWAIFGLIATAALTAVMTGAQLAGRTRLDLPLMLGTLVFADPDRARVAGFFIHLVNGWGFALGYTAVFAATGEATWWAGALLGALRPGDAGGHPAGSRRVRDRPGAAARSVVGRARTGHVVSCCDAV
jgi:hypothetical protein